MQVDLLDVPSNKTSISWGGKYFQFAILIYVFVSFGPTIFVRNPFGRNVRIGERRKKMVKYCC
jgi:hypothetical protein